jgi:hypothetical protein
VAKSFRQQKTPILSSAKKVQQSMKERKGYSPYYDNNSSVDHEDIKAYNRKSVANPMEH